MSSRRILVVGHAPFLPSTVMAACGDVTARKAQRLISRPMTEADAYELQLSDGTTITFVRHMLALPATDGSYAADVIRLPKPDGMVQAAVRQQQLMESGGEFTDVFTSPMVRAKAMAAILSAGSLAPIQILSELGYGDLSLPDYADLSAALKDIGVTKALTEGWTCHPCWAQLRHIGELAWGAVQNATGPLGDVIGHEIYS